MIKKLVGEKRTARSIWQRTHTADSSENTAEKATNLNQNSKKCGMDPLKNVSNVKRQDNSIWKLIKNKRKPKTASPPIRKYSTPPGPWAKSDKEKAKIFA
jgi:hypothetical protein